MNLSEYKNKNIIGAHVSLKSPDFLVGSINETTSYKASAFMIYTGAPQNTRRQPIEKLKIDQLHELAEKHHINLRNCVVHAPYVVNPANCTEIEKQNFTIKFLQEEIQRTSAIGIKYIVLHPGNHLKEGVSNGLKQCVKTLDKILDNNNNVVICLETMAGKGTEIGFEFEQLAFILKNAKFNQKIKVCLDTCHINDAGYNVKEDFEGVLKKFDETIGIQNLKVVHLNDSKNPMNARKDRHENIGCGTIGFQTLCNVFHHPKLKGIPFILETPWFNKKAPYKQEIMMLKYKNYDPNWREQL